LWNAGGPCGAAPSPFFLNETPAVSQPNSAAETPPIFPALPASFVGASSFEASRPTNQPEPKKEEPTFPPAPEAGSVKKSFVFGSSDEEQSSGVSGQEPIAPPAFAALTAPSSPPAADPFERIKSWANGETSPHAANPDASSAEQIKLSLSAILRQCSPIESGVNAELIPAWIQVSLPMEPIRTQFANGRVWVKLSDVANGLEPSFRNLLGQANPNALVELPVNDVFHALTAASAAKAQAQLLTDTPAPVVAPEPQAEPEISQPSPVVLEAVAPNPEVSSMPLTDSPAFAAEPESFASSGGEWPSMPPHGMGSFIIEPEGTSDFSEDTQEEVGFAHKTLAHEASAEPEPADMAPITLPVIIPANPHTGASAIVSQGPVEPSPRFSATSPEYSPARITGKASKQQLLLRALLGRSEELDPRTVVRFTGTQPGVAAVVCVHNGHKVESYTSPSEKNGDRFVEQAPMLLRHLEPLVDLTGINGTETFCIKTDERQITFSVQGPTALCVLHDPHHMEQGLAEKITLISRELAQMLKDSPPFA